jgi:cytochrome P450
MFESIAKLAGSDAPFFLLKLAREIAPCPVFQVPIPIPGGLYVVATGELQREVLNNVEADKPLAIYGKFDHPHYPPSIFSRQTKDPLWKVARKGSAPAFSRNQVDRMLSVCQKHLEAWIESYLEPSIQNGQSFDPSREMTFLTFETIMEAAFEYPQVSRERFDKYTHDLEIYLKEFGFKQVANPLRRYFGWFLPSYRQAIKAGHDNFAFLKSVVADYKSQKSNPSENGCPFSTNGSAKTCTIIELVLNNEGIPDDNHRIQEMLIFVAAGFDTTGYTLSTTLILMAKHPEIASKVRQAQSQMESPATQVSEYLACVIKESRRFLSVGALVSSRQFERAVTLGDYEIPAGATLLMPQMLSHRDESVYGDPDVFRPERWIDAAPQIEESLISFAAGPRNCIGQPLAIAELESVLPKLLSTYEFTLEEPGRLEYFLTLKYKGCRLKASKVVA